MFFLTTDAHLTPEDRTVLRKEFEKHTGEKCVILSHGLKLATYPTKKDKATSD